MAHASNTSISLAHNSYVHVTVEATNAAGLHSMAYSAPLLIDITPPVLAFVHDGLGKSNIAFSVNCNIIFVKLYVTFQAWK